MLTTNKRFNFYLETLTSDWWSRLHHASAMAMTCPTAATTRHQRPRFTVSLAAPRAALTQTWPTTQIEIEQKQRVPKAESASHIKASFTARFLASCVPQVARFCQHVARKWTSITTADSKRSSALCCRRCMQELFPFCCRVSLQVRISCPGDTVLPRALSNESCPGIASGDNHMLVLQSVSDRNWT